MTELRQLTQRHRALVIALLAALVLWNLPFGNAFLYPFKILATWIHETSHGLVMLFTGAGFQSLEIYRDTSGVAQGARSVGPAALAAIACAGYMGTAAMGAAFLISGQTHTGARRVLAILAAMMALSALFWVQNSFGRGVVTVGAIGFALMAAFANEAISTFVVNFIAAQSCINALLDIRVLFRTSLVVNGHQIRTSDAHSMAEASFGTPEMWATIWLLWSLALFYAALRITFLRQERARTAPIPAAIVD